MMTVLWSWVGGCEGSRTGVADTKDEVDSIKGMGPEGRNGGGVTDLI